MAELPTNTSRITRRIDAVFAKRRIGDGKLDHYRLARQLLRHQTELVPMIDDNTRSRFEALAKRISRV